MVQVELGQDDYDLVESLIRTLKSIGLILLRSSHKDLFSSIEWEELEEVLIP